MTSLFWILAGLLYKRYRMFFILPFCAKEKIIAKMPNVQIFTRLIIYNFTSGLQTFYGFWPILYLKTRPNKSKVISDRFWT